MKQCHSDIVCEGIYTDGSEYVVSGFISLGAYWVARATHPPKKPGVELPITAPEYSLPSVRIVMILINVLANYETVPSRIKLCIQMEVNPPPTGFWVSILGGITQSSPPPKKPGVELPITAPLKE